MSFITFIINNLTCITCIIPRFVKCESCSHFFVVLSEADQRVKVKDVKQAEQVLLLLLLVP